MQANKQHDDNVILAVSLAVNELLKVDKEKEEDAFKMIMDILSTDDKTERNIKMINILMAGVQIECDKK